MKLYWGFATVGSITILSRILGFIRDLLIAAVLGTSFVADALFVAFRLPNVFGRLQETLDAAFIPLFTKRLHDEGPAAARIFAGTTLTNLSLFLLVLTLVGEIAMPWLMLVLGPGFASDPTKFDLAVMLARIALPYLICTSLIALYAGVLNAFGRFGIAALAPAILNAVLIAVLLALIVLDGEQKAAGVALAWGIAVGGVAQVVVLALASAKIGMTVAWQLPGFTSDMRRLAALATPGIIASGMAQLTGVISMIIATLQDSVVSWLYYAQRIFQFPLGVIGVTIAVVLLPNLSHDLRAGDHDSAIAIENRALEFALLLTLPAGVALFVAADPILRVLFERGAFTHTDTNATATMLSALAPGLPAYVLIKVLHPSFFAREDTKTPMIFAGISMTANAVLSFTLFVTLGATGIAVASTLVGWLNVTLLLNTLMRREWFRPDRAFLLRLVGMAGASVVMGAVTYALVQVLAPWFAPINGFPIQALTLSVVVGAALLVYLSGIELFGAAKLRDLMADLTLR